jgi:hypothetical protein
MIVRLAHADRALHPQLADLVEDDHRRDDPR